MRQQLGSAALSTLALALAAGAHAQTAKPDDAAPQPSYTQVVKEKSEKQLKELTKKMDGWDNRLTVGTSFALSNSTSATSNPASVNPFATNPLPPPTSTNRPRSAAPNREASQFELTGS